jgi:hypothetical protein
MSIEIQRLGDENLIGRYQLEGSFQLEGSTNGSLKPKEILPCYQRYNESIKKLLHG